MEKNLEISMLYNIYGKMLTTKQKYVIDLYYNNDLSLREIAQIEGISAQGVRDMLKSAEKSLYEYEENIGLYNLEKQLNERIDDITNNIQNMTYENIKSQMLDVKNLINR